MHSTIKLILICLFSILLFINCHNFPYFSPGPQTQKLLCLDINNHGKLTEIVSQNSTVTLKEFNIMIYAMPQLNYVSWDEAEKFCKQLNVNNYNDWRLPTLGELKLIDRYLLINDNTLVEKNEYNTGEKLSEVTTVRFWSANTIQSNINAWLYCFGVGKSYWQYCDYESAGVIAVRCSLPKNN